MFESLLDFYKHNFYLSLSFTLFYQLNKHPRLSRDIITDSDDDLLLVDGLATYPWSDTFDTARVAAHIEYSNDSLFESLKTAIVAKLGPPPIGHVDGGCELHFIKASAELFH